MSDAEVDSINKQIDDNAAANKGKLSHQIAGVSDLMKVEVPVMKRKCTHHKKKVYSACWAEDSLHAVTCGQEGNVVVVDLSLNIIKARVVHKFVMQAAVQMNKGLVALGGMNNVVELWNIKDMANPVKSKVWDGHEGYISSLDFIEDGAKLLSSSGDGYAKLWDTEKKALIQDFHGHEQDISGVGLFPGSQIFATSSTDKTARVWDLRQQYAIRKFKTKYGGNCCAMMPQAKGIMVGCDGASWEFFDIGCNNQVARGKVKNGRCESIAVSASGRFVYMGWDDPKTGLTVADAYCPDNQKGIKQGDKDCHEHSVCSLNVAPDGSALLSSSFDCTAKVWGAP